ncbi:hypothetical protein M413DRAFT_448881 [Hebeloma cylindrosporum]|uniref:Uncharacterized protein n=1 Tax=Hebeloma cylindrosporum TaxID=76867 RepID=A0A0C2XFQ2_HEBCY|nr:hypothetical protein M413DRAFT_448881 [Hebeloma cylindrosporum h7]
MESFAHISLKGCAQTLARREGRDRTTAEPLTWPDGLKSEEATESPERAYDGDIDNKRVRSIRATPINVAPPSGQGSGRGASDYRCVVVDGKLGPHICYRSYANISKTRVGACNSLTVQRPSSNTRGENERRQSLVLAAGTTMAKLLRGGEPDGLKSEEAADSPKRAYAGDNDNKRVHHLLDSPLRLLAPSSGQGPGRGASDNGCVVVDGEVGPDICDSPTETVARRNRDTGSNSLKFITRRSQLPADEHEIEDERRRNAGGAAPR